MVRRPSRCTPTPLLILSWVVYRALPFATLFALSVAVTASSFKKYLQSTLLPIDRL